jgi:hypothetical protein
VKTVEWKGMKVDTVVTQFASYSDGRITEVALDYAAQGDDGSVWYFGEHVDNYKNGAVSDHATLVIERWTRPWRPPTPSCPTGRLPASTSTAWASGPGRWSST